MTKVNINQKYVYYYNIFDWIDPIWFIEGVPLKVEQL